MFNEMKLIFVFFLIPFSKLKKINPKFFLKNFPDENILYSNEIIHIAYDNKINSLLITNRRIIGISKVGNDMDVFSIPLFQLGKVTTYNFKFFKLNGMSVKPSTGFSFYWFFNQDVCMKDLSDEIFKIVEKVQIDKSLKLVKKI